MDVGEGGAEDEEMEIPLPSFSDAFERIFEQQQQQDDDDKLRKCVVKIGSLTGIDTGSLLNGVLDLEFLDQLRIEDDFLPPKVFFRQEMRTVLTSLVSEYKDGEKQRVLVGSPGVGKSVLFFLAALRRVVHHGEKVMYIRKTDNNPDISFFLMEKGDDSSVNVLSNRSLSKIEHPDLGQLCLSFVRRVRGFYIMLDGPHHYDSLQDRLQNAFHALCTSAGYPARRQEQIRSLSILVLNGWTESSIKDAIVALRKTTPSQANNIYELSGGRIRLAFMSKEEVEGWFNDVVTSCGSEKIKLAVTSQTKPGVASSSDRLRTRFYDPETDTNLMVVDSQYVMRKLISELESKDIVDAYNLARALKLQSARGWFYEEILNGLFAQYKNTQAVQGWIKSKGNGAEGVDDFIQVCLTQGDKVYWVPSIPNFANIDAAILVGSTLTCFQYTVRRSHTFEQDSFWADLVGKMVYKGVKIDKVCVMFVTPSDVEFQNDHQGYTKEYSFANGTETRSSAIQKKMHIFFSAIKVDVDPEQLLKSHIEERLLPLLTN